MNNTNKTGSTKYRDVAAGVLAIHGKRQLFMIGTSVSAVEKSRKMLVSFSFDRLFKRGAKAPGMKNTAYINMGGR